MTAGLAGCATYVPRPLDPARLADALAPPTATELTDAAGRLAHPRLAPIALDFSKPLSARALGVIAVLVNPELKALRQQEKVAQAQVFAAGLLPDPQISGGLAFPAGAPAGVTGLVEAYNASVNWAVAALVTRPARIRVARAQAEQVRNDIAWREWLVAGQARLLARRVGYLTLQETTAREAATVAGQLLDVTRGNLERGDATIAEFGLRQAAYLDAQDRALALGRQLETGRQELNRILGLGPAQPVAVAPPRVAMAPLPSAPAGLFDRAQTARLDLAALRAGYASQEARVHRAVLGQYPALNLGVGRARDTGGVVTIGFSVALDLPILDRNRGVIAVAEATRDQLWAEYANRLHQTRADIARLDADLRQIAREHAALARELPGLVRAERTLRGALATHDVTFLEYEAVRAGVLDKELKRLSLEQAAGEQQVALEMAVGQPLAP
ncbi:MAG TPA: TolC family protein [Methylomirabilota bacterium]|nr:TolC family protein [Methylomirabilota bacterium]